MKDKYGREIDYLRISLTDKCNLRCAYCMEKDHNDFIQDHKLMTLDEILRVVKECASIGIKKVRLTGGEPLVREGVVDLIKNINKIPEIEEICLTTNGILLGDKVKELSENGLKRVNISLDTLKEDRFKEITRIGTLDKVLYSIEKCLENNVKVKINTVTLEDFNKDEILDLINLAYKNPIDLRFIELMPIGEGKKFKGVTNSEILEIIKKEKKVLSDGKTLRLNGPAKYISIEGFKGKIGFISAMSDCFCEDCNRIRVTPEGFMKQCLHWKYGINLRDKMRNGISDEELREIIKKSIYEKPEKHNFKMKEKDEDKRFMYEIGG
ncbi:GTP 3',8-cyclase MoaA [Clostridium perfringens]|uniref:GTP 3',8-cyclase MoaA n=1 Tax=Clostridium perfringens TaxID=1502 RepID=UPI0018986A24|nr:GTP 3',8-cyclase MoaA [Clostridium perfringens]MBO3327533.1 GTP 3',8-cyclase MoaA [Clostridium perfringens]